MMHIFIDESGLFVQSQDANGFSAVVAYVIPESQLRAAEAALKRFKKRAGKMPSDEVKASDTSEENYFRLLWELGDIGGIVTGVVCDGSLQGDVALHKEQQAKKIDDYVPVMIHDEGKAMVAKAASDVRRLSNQNYVELHCRADLAWVVICRSTLYFVQREPESLGAWRWAFDAKDIQKNHFESTMADLVGTLSQTHSIEKPLIKLRGADYSHFDWFTANDRDTSWFPTSDDSEVVVMNGRLFHESMEFVDSRASPGVQIADLIANGLTKCLKGRFTDNDLAAALLGRLMISEPGRVPSVDFIMFEHGDEPRALDQAVARRVKIMDKNARDMVFRRAVA